MENVRDEYPDNSERKINPSILQPSNVANVFHALDPHDIIYSALT